MGNIFTLDSLREEIERQYAPVVLEVGDQDVTLTNLMRLPKKKRDLVMAKVELLNTDDDVDEDQDQIALDIILAVSDKPVLLKKALGDDLALIMKIVTVWMESTQTGEAESSSS